MRNIYSEYKLNPKSSKWKNFRLVNIAMQQHLWDGVSINDDIFALLMILDDQYTKWYNLAIQSNLANQKVLQKIEGIELACNQIELAQKEIDLFKTQSFIAKKAFVIFLRVLGLDYFIYSEGLRTNTKIPWVIFELRRNFVFFLIHFGLYYVVPIFLTSQSINFLPILIGTFLYNLIDSYRWTKMFYYLNQTRQTLKIVAREYDQT